LESENYSLHEAVGHKPGRHYCTDDSVMRFLRATTLHCTLWAIQTCRFYFYDTFGKRGPIFAARC